MAGKKTYLETLDETYPTKVKQKANRRVVAYKRYKAQRELGSHGAASGVRHIDPSTVDLSAYGVTQVAKRHADKTPVDLPWND